MLSAYPVEDFLDDLINSFNFDRLTQIKEKSPDFFNAGFKIYDEGL